VPEVYNFIVLGQLVVILLFSSAEYEKSNMSEANSVSTPIKCGWSDDLINKAGCEAPAPYRKAVGCLIILQAVVSECCDSVAV